MMQGTPSSRTMPHALTVKPRLARHLLLILLMLALVLGCGYVGYRLSERAGIRAVSENGERQLELNARAVESEITKYTYLPSLLELESNVSRLLLTPSPYRRQRVNDYLEGLNLRSGSLAIYVMDIDGRVLATSNWRKPDSYPRPTGSACRPSVTPSVPSSISTRSTACRAWT